MLCGTLRCHFVHQTAPSSSYCTRLSDVPRVDARLGPSTVNDAYIFGPITYCSFLRSTKNTNQMAHADPETHCSRAHGKREPSGTPTPSASGEPGLGLDGHCANMLMRLTHGWLGKMATLHSSVSRSSGPPFPALRVIRTFTASYFLGFCDLTWLLL